MLSDVTRLKAQQAQLETLARDRESMARRTRAILDSVLVGIVTVGPAGIEWMNRSARRMFGGELADFIDQPIETVATAEADHPFRSNRYLDELVEGEADDLRVPACRRATAASSGSSATPSPPAATTARASSPTPCSTSSGGARPRRAVSQAQASLQRVIERGAAGDRAARRRRRCACVQVNEVAARVVGETPERLIGTHAGGGVRRRASAPSGGATWRAPCARSEVTTARVPDRARRRAAGLGRALPAAGRGARRAARPAAAGRDRRHRAARRRRRRASRRRSRSATCWSRKCTTASRTTCRAWPGCCSRSPSASPRSPPAIDEVGRPGAGDRAGLRPAGRRRPGRCDGAACSRRSPARCGAPSAGRSAAASTGAARGRLDAARGRGDPDRADPQRAAHQRHQAQPPTATATNASTARSSGEADGVRIADRATAAGCRRASAWRGSRRRVRPRPGARAAAAAQRDACASSRPTRRRRRHRRPAARRS